MRKVKNTGLLILMLAAFTIVRGQTVTATASLDTSAIMIGDQIGLNLALKVPAGSQITWPVLNDTLVPHVEIIKRGKTDSIVEHNVLNLKRRLVITSFDSGYFNITPMKFQVRLPGSSKVDTVATQDLFLQVYAPQVDTTKAFKVIKGPMAEPYTLGEILPWILLGLLLLAGIIFLVWYLRKRKKNQPLFARKSKPRLPPDQEAIQRLEEVRLSRLWQAGKLKVYHTAITDIMRNYFARRFLFDAREMTTGEIMCNLEKEAVNKEALAKARSAFELADLVKFARLKPSPLENDTSLNYCLDFVNETKVVPQEEPAQTQGDEAQAENKAQTEEKSQPENKEEK
ncbi:MAG: hypothetical protein IEMM0006_1340 [bacterium]|nr:MAG: hypothetical protein IEMM0006_1340 [bacterium]